MSDQGDRIFPYHDGLAESYADPYRALRVLVVELGGDPDAVMAEANQGENRVVQSMAQQRLADAARKAFDMVAFDRATGSGATDGDCKRVFDDFLAWVKKKGTSTALTPTSAPPTAPSAYSVPGLSPLTPASASGPTSSDCGCG